MSLRTLLKSSTRLCRDSHRKLVGHRSVKVTGLAQKLGKLEAVNRDLQSKSMANLKLLGQPCNFHAREPDAPRRRAGRRGARAAGNPARARTRRPPRGAAAATPAASAVPDTADSYGRFICLHWCFGAVPYYSCSFFCQYEPSQAGAPHLVYPRPRGHERGVELSLSAVLSTMLLFKRRVV